MRRTLAIVVGMACVFAACGGDAPATGRPDRVAVASAAEVLTERWGDRLAFFAVTASLDAGYNVTQVIDHAAELLGDGTIPGVDPDGAPLGLLEPLDAPVGFDPELTIVAAPGGIMAGPEPNPQDWYVAATEQTLGEIFAAAEERIEADEVFGSEGGELAVAGVTEATIQLAASGYSAEQILEALITGHWLPPGVISDCAFIATTLDIETLQVVHPAAAPDFLCGDLRSALVRPSGDDPTGGPGSPGGAAVDADGTYAGSVALIDAPQQIAEILESTAEVTITGDVAEVAAVVMFEWFWDADPSDDEPACLLIDQMTVSGTGTVVDRFVEATLIIDDYVHIDQVGCTRGPSILIGLEVELAGELDGDSLVAYFYGDLVIEASRG